MSVKKLAAIQNCLLAAKLFKPEQVSSWAEDANLKNSVTYHGDSYEICRHEYDGIIAIENFSGDANTLLAIVSTWLIENDDTREEDGLKEPRIEIEVVDSRHCDVRFEIRLQERITIVRNDNGVINFRGEKYSVGEPEFFTADCVVIGDASGEYPPIER